MKLIDTHTHLYLSEFDNDIELVISNAIQDGVDKFLLPNIDKDSILSMRELEKKFPQNVYCMMGLHPTSVKEDYLTQLKIVESELEKNSYKAVGEIGIDLYWDKTFLQQQQEAFRFQLNLAIKHNLPVAIHSRDSFDEIIEVLNEFENTQIRGVFHCFSGNSIQALELIKRGFLLGIGGVVTFKNSGLDEVLRSVKLENLVIETDSPFLAPVPFRGKRNESKYCLQIADKIASIYQISIEEVAKITTVNAQKLFKI